MTTIDNSQFIKYMSERYGIEEDTAHTMLDMVALSLQELLATKRNIIIDEIGEFKVQNTTATNNEFVFGYIPQKQQIIFNASSKLLDNLK